MSFVTLCSVSFHCVTLCLFILTCCVYISGDNRLSELDDWGSGDDFYYNGGQDVNQAEFDDTCEYWKNLHGLYWDVTPGSTLFMNFCSELAAEMTCWLASWLADSVLAA